MDIQALLALQEEDGRLRELQRELRVLLPKRKAEAQARLQAARDAVEAATRENLAAQREIERFQRDYTRRREQMARAERNAAMLSDARALDAAMQEHASAAEAAARAETTAAGWLPDYVSIVDAETLMPLQTVLPGASAMLIACRKGTLRLIDNTLL